MSRLKRYALAIGLAILSPVFLVLSVALVAAFGVVGLWLLISDSESGNSLKCQRCEGNGAIWDRNSGETWTCKNCAGTGAIVLPKEKE